jgi:Tol biopolymer transport system component
MKLDRQNSRPIGLVPRSVPRGERVATDLLARVRPTAAILRSSLVLSAITSALCASAYSQATTRVSVSSAGAQANADSDSCSMTPDGRFVVFLSSASNLVLGDTNGFADVFVHDGVTGTTERMSVSSTGAQGNGHSGQAGFSISADGRFVAFDSTAANLVPGDTNACGDVFVHDRQLGTTERVSVSSSGSQGNYGSSTPVISADGRFVVFASIASTLVVGDINDDQDVFVRDRQLGTTELVSVNTSTWHFNGSGYCSMSPDGRYVVFNAWVSNPFAEVFLRDRQLGTTELVNVSTGGTPGNDGGLFCAVSADGRFVAFSSAATNLVPGDTNGNEDVFVRDRQLGTTERVSVDSNGMQANQLSYNPSISPDGRFVAFQSTANNLVPGDTGWFFDVFVHDRLSGATTRASVDSSGAPGNLASVEPVMSADGRYVVFESQASNLVSGDTNVFRDIFVRDRGSASAFVSLCFGDGTGAACPCGNTGSPASGCDNSAAAGGAVLAASGIASLSSDAAQLSSSGELPSALSIVLQGSTLVAPVAFGDGLRCAGGHLERLYMKQASGGVVTVPQAGDPPISARSAALGDPIPFGGTRAYQTYYRDPHLGSCPFGFNATNAVAIAWGS